MITRNRVLLLIVLLALVIGLRIFIPQKLVIRNITCSSQFGSCPEDVQLSINKQSGENINLVQKQLVEYLNSIEEIERYTIQFRPLSTLEVTLIMSKPVFAIANIQNPQALALIHSSGKVLGYSSTTSLPILLIDSVPPDVGEKVNQESLYAAKILSYLQSNYSIQSGNLKGDGLYITLPNGVKVIFPPSGDENILITSLQLILSQVKIDDNTSPIREIDLRFKNPVLR